MEPEKKRDPLRKEHLVELWQRKADCSPNHLCMCTMFAMCYFTVARWGDVMELRRKDVSFDATANRVMVDFQKSKTNQPRQVGDGITRTRTDLRMRENPMLLVMLRKWLVDRDTRFGVTPEDPLFLVTSGRTPARTPGVSHANGWLAKACAECGWGTVYTTHCARIGAATALLDAGTPLEVLKLLGAWVSDVALEYWKKPHSALCRVSRILDPMETDFSAAISKDVLGKLG